MVTAVEDGVPAASARTPAPDQPPKPPQGVIRWSGVIAFLVVAGAIAAVWFLVIDRVAERVVERTGTALVGAKVELRKADVTFFPLGVTLTGLQVANPDHPMTNAVEAARIGMALDPLNLLRRKVIVEKMTLDGVRLGTARATSGALPDGPRPKDRPGLPGLALPSINVPDVKAIIEKENLESLQLIESMRADLAAQRERIQTQLAGLPDKAKFDAYRKRAESLKEMGRGLKGLLGGGAEIVNLQRDIAADIQRLVAAKADIQHAAELAHRRVEDAIRAPQEDVARLKRRYSLGGAGAANVSRLLFGEQVAGWVETAFRWRDRLGPLIERIGERQGQAEVVKPLRAKGVEVRFPERAPLPDLLVRTAHASVELERGTISGQIRDITPDQPVLGRPLTFEFAGDRLQALSAVKAEGMLNRVNPAAPRDTVTVRIRGAEVVDIPLLKTNDLALVLQRASLDLDVQAALSGERVGATIVATLTDVALDGQGNPDHPVAQTIMAALRDIKRFDVKAEVTGTEERYDVALRSNADQIVGDIVGRKFREETARLEGELQRAVEARLAEPLAELKRHAGGLDALARDVSSRIAIGNEVLKSAVPAKGGFKLPF